MWRSWLTTILAIVFLASSVAAFGPWGMALAGYLLAILAAIWLWQARWEKQAGILIALLIGGPVLWGLVLQLQTIIVPPHGPRGEPNWCALNLRAIATALLNYEEQHGCLPPAYVCDKDGKPAHSWRVLILPYLELEPLYKMYKFDEPWNGPNNRLLAEYMPSLYVCPAALKAGRNPPPMTSYVVVTGADTAFPGCKSRRFEPMTAPRSDTVMVVEVANSDIHWMEPRDPSLEDLVSGRAGACQPLTSHHAQDRYWYVLKPGSGNVACADASVHYLPGPTSAVDAKAISSVTWDGKLRIEELWGRPPLVAGLRWDHVIGLPLFGLSFVALLCLALTTRRRHEPPVAEPLAVE